MTLGKGWAVFNPHNKPVGELPAIYGFNNGGPHGWMHAVLLAENGHRLGSHLCSSEGFMQGDLGILEGTRADRHEGFRKHYPDGYRMEWVPTGQLDDHSGFVAAIERNKALLKQESGE